MSLNSHCSILVIAVQYGDTGATIEFLRNLSQLDNSRHLTISIVNNGPDRRPDNVLFSVAEAIPNVLLVNDAVNRGYFGGARLGLSLYLEKQPLPQWVIVSNVDLVIQDQYFLNRLSALKDRPGVGVVAPSIRSVLTGRDQNPYIERRPSTARMHAYKWMYRSRAVLNGYEVATAAFHRLHGIVQKERPRTNMSASNESRPIYAPHGSFLIFSREYFRAGGSLDFPCFLFGEEIYVAETVMALGLEVIYEPSLVVTHQGHATTRLIKSRNLARAVATSAAYCADRYFPWD